MQDLSSALVNLGTAVTITYAAIDVHASALSVERRNKLKSILNKLVVCQNAPCSAFWTWRLVEMKCCQNQDMVDNLWLTPMFRVSIFNSFRTF